MFCILYFSIFRVCAIEAKMFILGSSILEGHKVYIECEDFYFNSSFIGLLGQLEVPITCCNANARLHAATCFKLL